MKVSFIEGHWLFQGAVHFNRTEVSTLQTPMRTTVVAVHQWDWNHIRNLLFHQSSFPLKYFHIWFQL